eukprot:COSAG01_NODE_9985_length_2283_cov_6.297619_2_plen_186_part_00
MCLLQLRLQPRETSCVLLLLNGMRVRLSCQLIRDRGMCLLSLSVPPLRLLERRLQLPPSRSVLCLHLIELLRQARVRLLRLARCVLVESALSAEGRQQRAPAAARAPPPRGQSIAALMHGRWRGCGRRRPQCRQQQLLVSRVYQLLRTEERCCRMALLITLVPRAVCGPLPSTTSQNQLSAEVEG